MKRGTTTHLLQALVETHVQLVKSKIPIETQNHFRLAHKEMLKGIRTWIDCQIEDTNQRAEKETSMTHSNYQVVKKIKLSD